MYGKLFLKRFYRNITSIRNKGNVTKKKPFNGDKILVNDEPYNSKIDDDLLSDLPEFDLKLISHLEKLSLVRFDSEQGVANLRKSVKIAKRLELVNTDNVEPMYTVWEDQHCPIYDDIEEKPLSIEEVFKNAAVRYDDYFVTPPGNIPLKSDDRFDMTIINEWDKIGSPTVPTIKKIKMVENKE